MKLRPNQRLYGPDDGGDAGATGGGAGDAGDAGGKADASKDGAGASGGDAAGKAGAGGDTGNAGAAGAAGDAGKKAADPKPDPAAWRASAVREILGEASDDEPADKKAEREKMTKLAERYTTMGSALKALRDAQKRISDGTLKAPLPKDATPEQVAEWRKENGIPEKPDGYDLGLKQGVVLSDGDKKMLDAWVSKVHGANASPDVVKAGAAALVELRESQLQEYAAKDQTDKAGFEDTMREEWGSDFRSNVAGIELMLGHAGEGVLQALVQARGPDGVAIGNNPAVMRWLASHAREMGFVPGTVVPAGGDIGKGVQEEIDGLEKRMRDDRTAWFKDAKAQARLMELYGARERMSKRAA